MAQPSRIEVQTGANRLCRLAALTVWLIAAVLVAVHLRTLDWPLLLAGCVMLFLLRPGGYDPGRHSHRLRLYRNGAAVLGDQTGAWGRQTWFCCGYAMLRIDFPQRDVRVMVCASRNSGDDYRSLRVWTRFAPFGADHHQRRLRP